MESEFGDVVEEDVGAGEAFGEETDGVEMGWISEPLLFGAGEDGNGGVGFEAGVELRVGFEEASIFVQGVVVDAEVGA